MSVVKTTGKTLSSVKQRPSVVDRQLPCVERSSVSGSSVKTFCQSGGPVTVEGSTK